MKMVADDGSLSTIPKAVNRRFGPKGIKAKNRTSPYLFPFLNVK